MRLGLGSYTFAWSIGVPGSRPAQPMTALALVSEARRLGLRLVQVCDNLPLDALSPRDLEAFEASARDEGIDIEIGTRGISEANLRRHLDLAVRLHSPLLRVVIDHAADEPSPREAAERLHVVLPEFIAAGVRLAIENHDRFPCRILVDMVEALDPMHVGICLDTVNSFGALEGPAIVVATLAPYTLSVHLKDFTVRRPSHQMGFLVEGCAAGTGRLDVPWLLAQLRVSRHASLSAILETWVTPGPDLAETLAREQRWTDEGVAFLRRHIPD